MSLELPREHLLTLSSGRPYLRFDEFMQAALFDETYGYYRRQKARVGRSEDTDFYTATSSGPLFGELVVAACASLLKGHDLSRYTFVEIGAEPDPESPDAGILKGVAHPFGATRVVRLGDPFPQAETCIVFSNELFDAQPCRRFRFRKQGWVELGVSLASPELSAVELTDTDLPALLPAGAPEGYVLDAPLSSVDLLRHLVGGPWKGLFVAFDYGKSWEELSRHTPQGTVRAYHKHRQSNHLYENVGLQDLTCHVCWDWLDEALRGAGFQTPQVQSQESFFIHHSGAWIAKTMAEEAARVSQRKMALMQLLHPGNLGQKFQVLHAQRS